MTDQKIVKSFAGVLRTAESSFGGEVDLLALKSDNGDAVVNELRWLERLTPEKCNGLVASLGNVRGCRLLDIIKVLQGGMCSAQLLAAWT